MKFLNYKFSYPKVLFAIILLSFSYNAHTQEAPAFKVGAGIQTTLISIVSELETSNPYTIAIGNYVEGSYHLPFLANSVRIGLSIEQRRIKNNSIIQQTDCLKEV